MFTDSRRGKFWVKSHGSAGKVLRIQPAEHEIGVRDGGLRSPQSVTCRSGLGARTLRPDSQRAARIYPGDRAAARADFYQVDHGSPDGVPVCAAESASAALRLGPHRVVLGHPRLAAEDHAHLCGCAAHIEGNQVLVPCGGADMRGGDRACGGARLHHEHGSFDRCFSRIHTAAALHDQQVAGNTAIFQTAPDVRQVAAYERPDHRVDYSGARPEVLTEFRRHLGGQRDGHVLQP